MKKPDFFIVGAPKCGTTAMSEYLAQHPEIFFCPIKEPNYFGKDLSGLKAATTLQEYLNLFKAAGNQICGEGSVWSLFSKTAANEIYDFNPNAKIIIMLRNPVDVLYSLHNQLVYDGENEDIEDFRLALEAEKDRRKGLRIPKSCNRPEALLYSDIVQFTEQIERYINRFGRENVHIIIYDDFKKDPLKAYIETLSFLSVSTNYNPNIAVVNPSKRVKNKALQSFLVERPLIVRLFSKFILPTSKLRYNLFMFLKLINTQYEPRPPIDLELKRHLQTQFAPEVKRLSKLLKCDLTQWSKN